MDRLATTSRIALSRLMCTTFPWARASAFWATATDIVDKVIGGWGVDGITTYALGFPLIFTAQPTFLSQQFGAGRPRPNVVPGCQKKLSGSAVSRQHGWFNTQLLYCAVQLRFRK